MQYGRRSRFVKLHAHNPGICHFNRRFSLFCMMGLCAICVILSLVVVALFFVFVSRPCTNDSQCQMKNPCAIDTCMDGWCEHKQIEHCCMEDTDCGTSGCYTSFCDTFQHTCQTLPKMNGSACSDSNSCTIDTTCQQGICKGKTLTCQLDNECRTGECKGGIGCVFHNKPNGYSCNDNNPCTSQDECYNGMCAVGYAKDCSNLNDVCTIGACDITTGNCIALARNDGDPCDDGLSCTENDVCTGGTCQGTQRTCFDNNPCTIDACHEGVGCMIQHQDYGETCIPGCAQHNDCPVNYNCYDGTCIKTQAIDNQHIRMIGYEIDDCASDAEKKLELHFVLDTEKFTLGNEDKYRIIASSSDITPHPSFNALGFGDTVSNLAHNNFGNNVARTSFTVATACQPFDHVNCAYIFNNREWRLAAKMHDCTSISGPVATGCIDPMHVIWASISLSISTCSMFPQHVNLNIPRGGAVVYYQNNYYRSNDMFQVDGGDTYGWVGIETEIYNKNDKYAVITDMRICQAQGSHYLTKCVDGTNTTECFNTGCFNWDESDSPLTYQVDIISNKSVTAIARSSTFSASGCYFNDNYDKDPLTICSWDKCDSHGMDDNFQINFKPLADIISGAGNIFIFDIKYRYTFCGMHGRRRLLASEGSTDHYAMGIFKLIK